MQAGVELVAVGFGVLAAAPDEFRLAVDYELRCVDTVETEELGVFPLAVGKGFGGEAIFPGAVPVVDVFAEDDEVCAVVGLLLVEVLYEFVGGRATGAAFGGEELEKYRGFVLCAGSEGEGEEGDCEFHRRLAIDSPGGGGKLRWQRFLTLIKGPHPVES